MAFFAWRAKKPWPKLSTVARSWPTRPRAMTSSTPKSSGRPQELGHVPAGLPGGSAGRLDGLPAGQPGQAPGTPGQARPQVLPVRRLVMRYVGTWEKVDRSRIPIVLFGQVCLRGLARYWPHIVATRLLFVDILKCLISFKKDVLLDPYKVTKH